MPAVLRNSKGQPKPRRSAERSSRRCSAWPKGGFGSCWRHSGARSRSMPEDPQFLQLVERVGRFYLTDKAMKGAQKTIEIAIAAGDVGDEERRRYLQAVRRYFTGFEREARGHLRDVDKRLEHVNQVQFNLTAERGVAVRRIEATQEVLRELDRWPER